MSSGLASDLRSHEQQLAMVVLPTKDICDETIEEIVHLTKYIGDVFESGERPYMRPDGKPWEDDDPRALLAGRALFPTEGDPMKPAFWGAFVGWEGDLKEKVEQHKYLQNYMANFMRSNIFSRDPIVFAKKNRKEPSR